MPRSAVLIHYPANSRNSARASISAIPTGYGPATAPDPLLADHLVAVQFPRSGREDSPPPVPSLSSKAGSVTTTHSAGTSRRCHASRSHDNECPTPSCRSSSLCGPAIGPPRAWQRPGSPQPHAGPRTVSPSLPSSNVQLWDRVARPPSVVRQRYSDLHDSRRYPGRKRRSSGSKESQHEWAQPGKVRAL